MPTTGLTLRQLAERDERAFPSYPQVSRYFPGRSIEDARARLGRAIERGDGPGLIIGGPGTGKSLLLQVLASQYQERFDVVLPTCARLCTRRALLQAILFELGLPYRSRDEGELRLSLLDHLLSMENCPTGLLLLVDEAQTLSIALLDELRVLTNLVRGALPRVRLVLAGSSSLEECFAHPELESFSQRLSARCYLGPFSQEETSQFIAAQLAACGAVPDRLFSLDARLAVFEATDGVPRLVNQLCDRTLSEAITVGRSEIGRDVIQAAWADLQQLPTPWDTPQQETASATSQVVEFGNLTSDQSNENDTYALAIIDEDSINDAIVISKVTEFDTELDINDESDDEYGLAESSIEISMQPSIVAKVAADPFAEKFDEEEIVLDNFAAWDDMFRRLSPRVANRRDPEFTSLVGEALHAAAADNSRQTYPNDSSLFEFELQDEVPGNDQAAHGPDPVAIQSSETWPSLRIAEVSDLPATSPFPMPSIDDDPVLIVEDDAAVHVSPVSPVRREEYRHLFSRLRSG